MGGVGTPGLVEAGDEFVPDVGDDVVDLPGEVLVNDMLVKDGLQQIWRGEGVVALELVVVSRPDGGDVVGLVGQPSQLFVGDDYVVAARDVREDVCLSSLGVLRG